MASSCLCPSASPHTAGSDSVESAQREIALWFGPKFLCDWTPHADSWVYERPAAAAAGAAGGGKNTKICVLFDVDGTLTPARKEVTADVLAMLRELRQRVVVGFVGGKCERLPWISGALALRLPLDSLFLLDSAVPALDRHCRIVHPAFAFRLRHCQAARATRRECSRALRLRILRKRCASCPAALPPSAHPSIPRSAPPRCACQWVVRLWQSLPLLYYVATTRVVRVQGRRAVPFEFDQGFLGRREDQEVWPTFDGARERVVACGDDRLPGDQKSLGAPSISGLGTHVDHSRIAFQLQSNQTSVLIGFRFLNFGLQYLSGVDCPVKRGTFFEFRTGMINVSPVGRNCSQDERMAFNAYVGRGLLSRQTSHLFCACAVIAAPTHETTLRCIRVTGMIRSMGFERRWWRRSRRRCADAPSRRLGCEHRIRQRTLDLDWRAERDRRAPHWTAQADAVFGVGHGRTDLLAVVSLQ